MQRLKVREILTFERNIYYVLLKVFSTILYEEIWTSKVDLKLSFLE